MGAVKSGSTFILITLLLGLALQKSKTLGGFDLDSDGEISMTEIWNSIDVGKRETTINGRTCIEYFKKKDGLSLKEVCDEHTP